MNPLRIATLHAFFLLTGILTGANHNVGPGQALATLSAVPWAALQPGDFVNIHYQPGGYHEKIQISASGTAAAHVVIRGIPDPVTGALPVIDGRDAVEDPSIDWRNDVLSKFGIIVVSPRKTGYVYGVDHVRFVDIETLDIRNALYTADGSVTYTDKQGAVRGYDSFGCGIYIEWAHDLAVRGCEISNCGNGLFANSKNGVAQSSARLLIERNYFHDNSHPALANPDNPAVPLSNGFHEHHCYTEGMGVIYQYNRFGPLRAGAHGVAIKDRSSGQIIRYNEFVMNGQSNVLNLADPQGGGGLIDAQPDYRDSFVYGNLITIEDYAGSMSMVFWGAFNGPGFYAAQHRGTLHFYHNTIISHHDNVSLFLLPDSNYTGASPTYENVDCRNNVFYTDTAIQGSIYNAMHFFTGGAINGGGGIALGVNWISPNWRKDSPNHAWSGPLTGTGNLIVGDAAGANDPHCLDLAARDCHVLTGSTILDAAGALSPAALAAHDVTLEYLGPQSYQPRVMQGIATDLGALESTGLVTPPPPGGALQFGTGAFGRTESGGLATITVTRVGGSMGAVGISYSTPAGGTAGDAVDYAPVIGTLAWPDGDAAPKSFTVPVLDDAMIENPETVSLALFAPTGGAVPGSQAMAVLTITDDDTPPSTLMYGLGHISNALFLFKSDAPGTPLSFTIPGGMAAGDSLRALAVQPVTGKLFAVGTAGILYTLDPFTGVATAVGPAFSPAPNGETMDLTFDRVTGLLRLIGSSGQNLILSPVSGAMVAVDTTLAFASGDANAATVPQVVGADHVVNNSGQTLYGLDAAKDVLVTIGPAGGQLDTVGTLGFNTIAQAALHIPTGAAFGWACLSAQGEIGSGLYAVNLATGGAIFLGAIRNVEQVRDFVVAPPRDAWRQARFGANAGVPLIAGDTADPDGNGVSNLMEYALGGQAADPAGAFTPVASHAGDHLSLTFKRPVTATDLTYTVQVSGDVMSWHDGSTYAPAGDVAANAFTSQTLRSTSGGIETITVRDNTPVSAAASRFMRLIVTAP